MKMHRVTAWMVHGVAWMSLGVVAPAEAAFTFGTNLIANANAEKGNAHGNGSYAVADWSVVTGPAGANGFTAFSWTFGAGYPVYADHGPTPPATTREGRFFYGGLNCPASAARQTITGATAAEQAAIDAGLVIYDMTGWLGGYLSQDDDAGLTLNFLDANGTALGSASLGPDLAADRGRRTALLFRQTTGAVPRGRAAWS